MVRRLGQKNSMERRRRVDTTDDLALARSDFSNGQLKHMQRATDRLTWEHFGAIDRLPPRVSYRQKINKKSGVGSIQHINSLSLRSAALHTALQVIRMAYRIVHYIRAYDVCGCSHSIRIVIYRQPCVGARRAFTQ